VQNRDLQGNTPFGSVAWVFFDCHTNVELSRGKLITPGYHRTKDCTIVKSPSSMASHPPSLSLHFSRTFTEDPSKSPVMGLALK